jgi:outer membrane protein assembly factor BamA
MNSKELTELIGIKEGMVFKDTNAKEFENLICACLEKLGKVKRQVIVSNRGDGRRGRIDIVFKYNEREYPIEVDRVTPRRKSVFKVINYAGSGDCFVIVRENFKVYKVGN